MCFSPLRQIQLADLCLCRCYSYSLPIVCFAEFSSVFISDAMCIFAVATVTACRSHTERLVVDHRQCDPRSYMDPAPSLDQQVSVLLTPIKVSIYRLEIYTNYMCCFHNPYSDRYFNNMYFHVYKLCDLSFSSAKSCLKFFCNENA